MSTLFGARSTMLKTNVTKSLSAPSIPLRPTANRLCFPSTTKYSSKARDGTSSSSDDERDLRDRAKEAAEKAKEKAREGAQKAEETSETAKEKTREQLDKAKDTAKEGVEKAKEGAETAKEKTKEGTSKVAETAQNLGEKAKQTVQGAWGAAKETTQKIKETVVGKADEKVDDRDDLAAKRDTDLEAEARTRVRDGTNEDH